MQFLIPAPRQPYAKKVFDQYLQAEKPEFPALWLAHNAPCDTLKAAYTVLRDATKAGAVMVHGSVIGSPEGPIARRSVDRDNQPATISDTPSPWIAIDLDHTGVMCGATPEEARAWWVDTEQADRDAWYHDVLFPATRLPEYFRGVQCLMHISSSCFLKTTEWRGHLIFRLDNPVQSRYWRTALLHTGADTSKYGPEHVLYLSNPAFRGINPWSSCGPYYAWRRVTTGAEIVQVPAEAPQWVQQPLQRPTYITGQGALPEAVTRRWWRQSGTEALITETTVGDRHRVMVSTACRVANAITMRQLDDSAWAKFQDLWVDKGKDPAEIASTIAWAQGR